MAEGERETDRSRATKRQRVESEGECGREAKKERDNTETEKFKKHEIQKVCDGHCR